MSESIVIPKDEQAYFWDVVKQCIETFHTQQNTNIDELRAKVDCMPLEQMEMFYHAEPFDVACNLANNIIDIKEYSNEYLNILFHLRAKNEH